jgi:hypothetical protein
MCHSKGQLRKPQTFHPHSCICNWNYIDVVNNPLNDFDYIYKIANANVMGMGKL